jgi:polygalacturonase
LASLAATLCAALFCSATSCIDPSDHSAATSQSIVASDFAPDESAFLPKVDDKPPPPHKPHHTFNFKTFGGIGDGKTLNTNAFQTAMATIAQQGGGHLVVPAGVYKTTAFSLCSNLDLHLEQGAIIQAPQTFAEFGLPDPQTFKDNEEVKQKVTRPRALINGSNLHDVAITGTGAIDGSGALWWAWSERAGRQLNDPHRIVYPRPTLFGIDGCQRLHINGVTFQNSANSHVQLRRISNLLIEHVRIRAPWLSPNTDGIDTWACDNIIIRDCDIDTGDDDICIKLAVDNCLVENCQIAHGHGISIGSQTNGGIHNLLVRHCTFNGTDNGIRIKSMRGRGGLVSHVRFSDLQMNDVENVIVFDSLYVDNNHPDFTGPPSLLPRIDGILIDNLHAQNALRFGYMTGLPDAPISNVFLHDVQVDADADLVLKDVHNIHFENVGVTLKQGLKQPKFRIE